MTLKSFHREDTIAHSPPAGQSDVPSHINTSVPPSLHKALRSASHPGTHILSHVSSHLPHPPQSTHSSCSRLHRKPTARWTFCTACSSEYTNTHRADFLSPSRLYSKSPSCAFSVTFSLPYEQTPPPAPTSVFFLSSIFS